MRSNIDTNDITKAISIIKSTGIANSGLTTVPRQFTGYVSSFGASVIHSGLIPTVIFFEDENANPEEKRHLLIDAIKSFLGITPALSAHLLTLPEAELFGIEEEILEAAQIIKLALRTFKKAE